MLRIALLAVSLGALGLSVGCGGGGGARASTIPTATADPQAQEKGNTETQTSEEPPSNAPSDEAPTTEQPSTEQPSTEQPSTEQPSTEQPSSESTATSADESPTTGQITVVMKGFRKPRGRALLVLFTHERGWPRNDKLAFKRARVTVRGKTATVVFKNVPPGEFAVAMLHDENGNGKMDSNFVGIPQEGFGFSRNPELGMGPPDWSQAALRLPAGQKVRVVINLKYL